MELNQLLNHDITCSCGRTHRCDIDLVDIGRGAVERLPESVKNFENILLVADSNTFAVCGERVSNLLGAKIKDTCIFVTNDLLVPDEAAIEAVRAKMTPATDLILGIGSGVINDVCKYVSFFAGISSGIVATAPSMDGFASSGAAMILGGMKVTETTHAPALIIGDTEVLKNAPAEMIRSGYADIIGKYSALNDWKLSRLINGEYLCPEVYALVKEKTDLIRSLAKNIAAREDAAIEELMRDLVLIGVTLTLLSTTRPGSGSEHHLSHYFEITGLLNHHEYYLHGIDVLYSAALTARLREALLSQKPPFAPYTEDRDAWEKEIRRVYTTAADGIIALQDKVGLYADIDVKQLEKAWQEVCAILREAPGYEQMLSYVTAIGLDINECKAFYGKEILSDAVRYAKDLKDRYTVLWIAYALGVGYCE